MSRTPAQLLRSNVGRRLAILKHQWLKLFSLVLFTLSPLAATASTDALMIDPAKNRQALARIFVKMPKPDYPLEARRKNITGHGVFDVSIRPKTGLVTHVEVFRSTGSKILDDAAVRTLLQWQTRPGVRGLRVPLSFSSESALIYVSTCWR